MYNKNIFTDCASTQYVFIYLMLSLGLLLLLLFFLHYKNYKLIKMINLSENVTC